MAYLLMEPPGGAVTPTPPTPVDREALKRDCAALAASGVYLGTSSWKYPGWQGQLYDASRYVYRGKFSESRFERTCLAEYAEVFHTVCVDAAYYTFPNSRGLGQLAAQVPPDFRFTFKVTDEITVKHFPRHPRFGIRGGTDNSNFLNSELFERQFLGPMEALKQQLGLLIFEFSRFYPSDFKTGREFVSVLDGFLGRLPQGWPYGVEIRNRTFLVPEYFETLARHGVTHVYNSWESMPSLAEQRAMPGSRTHPERCGARLLLRPGREYSEAVERFAPYDRVQDENPEIRQAAAELAAETVRTRDGRTAFVYVNNRLEGNALATISGIIAALIQTGVDFRTAA